MTGEAGGTLLSARMGRPGFAGHPGWTTSKKSTPDGTSLGAKVRATSPWRGNEKPCPCKTALARAPMGKV